MKRRNFISTLLTGTASFFILPGAGRIWKPENQIIRVFFTGETFISDVQNQKVVMPYVDISSRSNKFRKFVRAFSHQRNTTPANAEISIRSRDKKNFYHVSENDSFYNSIAGDISSSWTASLKRATVTKAVPCGGPVHGTRPHSEVFQEYIKDILMS